MILKLSDLDLEKVYSYADYYSWKFVERVELIEGIIFPMDIESNRLHQEISGILHLKLGNYLQQTKYHIYAAPFDVRFPNNSKKDSDIYTVLQPDLCVICDLSKLDDRGCNGAPDLVVEILSPSNSKKELKNKYEVYEEAGVKEYWVVFPVEKTMIIYTLINEKYQPSRLFACGDIVTSSVLPGLSIDLEELFSDFLHEDELPPYGLQ